MGLPPRIIGHRGAGLLAPENTLAAVKKARSLGIDAVELDIQASSDGSLVTFHDDTLDRTTNGHGRLDEMPLKALKKLDAGGWFDPSFRDEPIPVLEDLFPFLQSTLTAFLELKDIRHTDALGGLIIDHDAVEHCNILSFSEKIIAYAARQFPAIKRAYIHHPSAGTDDLPDTLNRIPANFLGLFPAQMDPQVTEPCRQQGIEILTGPVNDSETLDRVMPLSPEFILSDRPDLIKNAISSSS